MERRGRHEFVASCDGGHSQEFADWCPGVSLESDLVEDFHASQGPHDTHCTKSIRFPSVFIAFGEIAFEVMHQSVACLLS
jgi:hypothetical protein